MEGAETGIQYEQDESNFRLEASANLVTGRRPLALIIEIWT